MSKTQSPNSIVEPKELIRPKSEIYKKRLLKAVVTTDIIIPKVSLDLWISPESR